MAVACVWVGFLHNFRAEFFCAIFAFDDTGIQAPKVAFTAGVSLGFSWSLVRFFSYGDAGYFGRSGAIGVGRAGVLLAFLKPLFSPLPAPPCPSTPGATERSLPSRKSPPPNPVKYAYALLYRFWRPFAWDFLPALPHRRIF